VINCGKRTFDHAGNFFGLDDVCAQSPQRLKLGSSNTMGTQTMAATRESAKPAQWRLKITFWLDVTLLLSICALQTVRFTGLVLHEWLGLAMVGMVLAHLLLAWSWIASQSRRFFTLQSIRARINYLLNLILFAAVTAVIFSGILISQKAIPTLTGTKAAPDMDWRWDALHNQFSAAVVMLVRFHLAINWEWALAAGQKIFHRFLEGAR
jgi:cation transport ATPase